MERVGGMVEFGNYGKVFEFLIIIIMNDKSQ